MSKKNIEIGYIDSKDKIFKNLSQEEISIYLNFIADWLLLI